MAIQAAARAVGHWRRSTWETTTGASIKPTLAPVAASALASAPAWNQRTAMSSRKVVPAVSSTPAASARHFS